MEKPGQSEAGQKVRQEELSGLMASLSNLYRTVARRLWNWRVHHYHKDCPPDVVAEIEGPLGRHIDDLSGQSEQRTIPDTLAREEGIVASMPRDQYREVILGDVLNDFTEQRKVAKLDAGLGERLRHSTWEHIHQSLRLARAGDDSAARMHAGFANNALKEAGHYLSETDYRALVTEVSDYLAEHRL